MGGRSVRRDDAGDGSRGSGMLDSEERQRLRRDPSFLCQSLLAELKAATDMGGLRGSTLSAVAKWIGNIPDYPSDAEFDPCARHLLSMGSVAERNERLLQQARATAQARMQERLNEGGDQGDTTTTPAAE